MQVSATCWAILPYWALGTCLVRTITESHRPTEPAEPAPASDGNVIPNTSFGTWPLGRTPITICHLIRVTFRFILYLGDGDGDTELLSRIRDAMHQVDRMADLVG